MKECGSEMAPYWLQKQMFESIRRTSGGFKSEADVLALLNHLIEQGIPVPEIYPPIRTFSRATRSLACTAYFAARRALSERLQEAARSSRNVVFQAPLTAAASL
jgi:hypothetical protein